MKNHVLSRFVARLFAAALVIFVFLPLPLAIAGEPRFVQTLP